MASRNTLPWQEKALDLIADRLYQDHSKVTGEDVRLWLKSQRLKAPSHPNCYGAMIRQAINEKLLKPTTKFAASEAPKSKGRVRRIYTVTKPRKSA